MRDALNSIGCLLLAFLAARVESANQFSQPSAAAHEPKWIVGGLVFILLQTILIAYLLLHRHRLRQAEFLLGRELHFESLFFGLSAHFANLPADQMNDEIEKTLEKLMKFLELDRISLYTTSPGDTQEFVLQYSASLPEVYPGPPSLGEDKFLWLVATLQQGKESIIDDPGAMPPDTRGLRNFLLTRSFKSAAFVPLRAAGTTLGTLAYFSHRRETHPDAVVQQLRVVAEIFANALIRKKIEGGLLESQERFQAMSDNAPFMIWMSGIDHLCTFFNKRWLEFTGRRLEQELGNGWAENVHPEDMQNCLKTYFSSFEARLPFTLEYRLRRANGDYAWVFQTGVPRYLPGGEFTGYIGSCTDITEQRQAQQGILDLSGRLISAQEEERARIARELHDDFSQRLALLAMQLDQISQGLPTSNKPAIDRLHTMWERTTELSADIHKLSHRLHSSKLHHVGLLAAARSLCEETGRQHGIEIDFLHSHVPDEIPPDMGLCLFRIVQEALSNIVKHSGATQAHVELMGTDSHLRIRIVDAGVGFDPNSRSVHGGLGLASMRERLRYLGGTISLCSRPMEGTEIVAEVPISHSKARAHYQ